MKSLGWSTTSKILTFKRFHRESVLQGNCIKVFWQSWFQSQMEWDSIEAILFLIIERVIWLLWQIKLSSRKWKSSYSHFWQYQYSTFLFLMVLLGKAPFKNYSFMKENGDPHATPLLWNPYLGFDVNFAAKTKSNKIENSMRGSMKNGRFHKLKMCTPLPSPFPKASLWHQ